ncbi:sialidase family protein [Lederbergia citrea]|uniref:FIMAH domain-containing protein n=1 Tax=Lederbergia citrea TaxID=2833581 RepID=A0A942UP18_9BACI|nr:sialidase family protein [Lederbergia citrea]MBS4224225.1 hypothetical protein [Lederbergia citrea]
MKKTLLKATSFLLGVGLVFQSAVATAAPAKDNTYQKPDQWKMIEPGAGGAFFAVGAGPTGIAVAAGDLSGPYISYDNGKSWETRGTAEGILYHTHFSMVGFDPEDERSIFVGAEDMMYKSDDKGKTFYPILSEDWDPFKRTGTFKVVRDLKPGEIGTKYKHPLQDVHDRWADEPFEDGALLYFNAMTFSKSNPNIGYTAAHSDWEGTDAIIFKTTDRGETWSPVKAFINEYDQDGKLVKFLQDKRVQKVVVDHKNPNIVYILSQTDGFTGSRGAGRGPQNAIYKSTDGGVNWTLVGGDMLTYNISSTIPLYNNDGSAVYTVNSDGNAVAMTRNSGSITEPRFVRNMLDIEMDPVDPNILYAVKGARGSTSIPGNGVYKSTDGGSTWKLIDNRIGAIKLKAVDNDPDKTIVRRIIFNGWEGTSEANTKPENRSYPQVWESTDAGATWTQVASPLNFTFGGITHWYSSMSAYSKTIATSMADPDVYYWGDGQWVYMSDDGARNFRSAGSTVHHEDEDGKWYTTTGVSNVVSFTLKVSEADPNIVFIGNADIGLWRSLDNGRSWQHANEHGYIADWVYYGGQAQAIALDPERPNVVWAGLGGAYVEQLMIKSTDYGKLGTWKSSGEGLPKTNTRGSQTGSALRGLSVDKTSPTNNRTLYVVANDIVFKSVDDGETWKESLNMRAVLGKKPYPYQSDYRADRQAATAVDHTDGNYVYAGGADGLFRSNDAGTKWEQIGGSEFAGVQKIVISKQNPEHVYAAIGQVYDEDSGDLISSPGLYRSTDRGANWELILEDEFLRGFDVNPHDENIIMAGSSNVFMSGGTPESDGALLTVDGGKTWQQVNEGLSWPFVRDVEFNPHDPSQVFIVTPGTSHHVRYFDFSKYKDELKSLQSLLDQYVASGEVNGPLVNQLSNSLDQAIHQFNKGSNKQAVKKIEDFLKHLNNPPKQKNVTSDAKEKLNKAAEALIQAWSK